MSNSWKLTSRFTPINDVYPSCDRACAKLLIYPDMVSHQEVTERLHLTPTDCQNKGDVIVTSSGRQRTAKLTMWLLSSEPYVESKDLRRHIDWILDQIVGSEDSLLQLQKEQGTRMAVSCAWWSLGGGGGPTIWPEQMVRLAELNLELTIGVQFHPEDGV